MTTALADSALQSMLGDDLHAIVRASRLVVLSARRISPLHSDSWPRAAFRLDLADGSSLKGHRLESEAAAIRAERLGRFLPHDSFPSIVARHGAALLSSWVNGLVLSSGAVTGDHVRRVGQIQRVVHTTTIPKDIADAAETYPGASWRADLTAKVASLEQFGHVDSADSARILDLAEIHAPADVDVRLTHGDMCPENVVVDANGALHIVDNDAIDMHACAFDLARTWYRWPMTAAERRAFEDGYGAEDVVASFHQHFLHWALIVLVGACEFRLRQSLPGVSKPLGQLREILRRGAARP